MIRLTPLLRSWYTDDHLLCSHAAYRTFTPRDQTRTDTFINFVLTIYTTRGYVVRVGGIEPLTCVSLLQITQPETLIYLHGDNSRNRTYNLRDHSRMIYLQ